MKMNRYGIFLLVLSLAMVGCLPSSENPLPSQGDITGIAAPFLGNWLLTEMLNRSDVGYMTLDIALQGTTQLEAVRGDGLHTATMALTMHKYGSRIFVTH